MRGIFGALFAASLATALAGCATAPGGPPGATGIAGRVVMKDGGAPVPGAFVYVYRDWARNLTGISDFVSLGTSSSGEYRMDVPPGKYGVVARRRRSGESFGTLSTGDDYDNRPGAGMVEVKAGALTRVDFSLVTMREPMFFRRNPEEATETGIRGRILDGKGAPVVGAFAIAYQDADMKRLPDFASTLTDAGGRFTLFLPAGGRYWLGGRTHVRDMPRPDEPYGLFEGSPDHSIEIGSGRFLDGIDITVRPFKGTYVPGKIGY